MTTTVALFASFNYYFPTTHTYKYIYLCAHWMNTGSSKEDWFVGILGDATLNIFICVYRCVLLTCANYP